MAATVAFTDARRALLSCAAEGDLLIVGASRHWSVSRWLPPRRSVTGYCVRHATCPVIVVPAHAAAREAEAWGPLGRLRRRHELATLTTTGARSLPVCGGTPTLGHQFAVPEPSLALRHRLADTLAGIVNRLGGPSGRD